jgi:hypothetical protein
VDKLSENKTNTNETEKNVVENTTAETQNQNIEVEDNGDYISAIPKKTSRKATNLLRQRQTAAHQTFTIG